MLCDASNRFTYSEVALILLLDIVRDERTDVIDGISTFLVHVNVIVPVDTCGTRVPTWKYTSFFFTGTVGRVGRGQTFDNSFIQLDICILP